MALNKLFKQTMVYGIATVFPRLLSFLLVPLYTSKGVLSSVSDYGEVSVIFSYFILFNVVLTYGMETALFRFYNKSEKKETVLSTIAISVLLSTISFVVLTVIFKSAFSTFFEVNPKFVKYILCILLFDVLAIIPFAYLRIQGNSFKYAFLKIINSSISLSLNLFVFLVLKPFSKTSFLSRFYVPNFEVDYILLSNVVASLITFILLGAFYFRIKYSFSLSLWKSIICYAFPVLISGLAFSINESFDKILLNKLLPQDIASTQVGMYAACYKLGIVMTLFATAFRLGIEPYFFSHFKSDNPEKNYASILEIFVSIGALILLFTVVFTDLLKTLIVRSSDYWQAISIVPIILIANYCLGIYHNLSVWYKVTDRTKFGAYISIVGAVLTLFVNIFFIPKYGFKASAIATLIAYFFMMVASLILGRKYYPIPYNFFKIGVVFCLSILFSILHFYSFRENYLIGGAFILIMSLVILNFYLFLYF